MITRIKSQRIITPSGTKSGYLYLEDAKILAVTDRELPFDRELDAGSHYVAPGFIDTHVHGACGKDFSKADAESITKAVNFHLSHGTTTIFPTISAVKHETTLVALAQMRKALASGKIQSHVHGVHMEGPYFSLKQCGAQNPKYITPPVEADYTQIVREYGDLVKRWSFAPELPGSVEFCKYLTAHGIVPTIGHSDAIYEDCMAVYPHGCRFVTHFYSCTSTITRDHGFRRLGIIETAYLHDDIQVEIIADGRHLPPNLIRLILKQKGIDNVCLITDAIAAAGTESTESDNEDFPYIIEDGVAKLPDRSAFAGSIATTDRLIRVCVQDCGVSMEDAVKMATQNPAKVFGVHAGRLEEGYPADVVVFNDNIEMQHVFVSGSEVTV